MRNGYSIAERTAVTQNPEVPSMQLRRGVTKRHQHVSEEEGCCLDTAAPASRAATIRTPACLLMPGEMFLQIRPGSHGAPADRL